MVGNAVDARIAWDKHFLGMRQGPKGWRNIGEGSTRTVYLPPTRQVVYKVGDNDVNLEESTNSRKYAKIKALRELNVFVPAARCWRVPGKDSSGIPNYVLAMEYVPQGKAVVECDLEYYWRKPAPVCNCKPTKTRPCFYALMDKISDIGITDMWAGNIHYNNGKFYVIDLGYAI